MYRFVVLDESYQTYWYELQSLLRDCDKSYEIPVFEMILVCKPFHLWDAAKMLGYPAFR